MDKYGEELKGRINEFRDLLSQHEVLNEFWPRLSLILKGSVARGNADKYSDLDFVFYCDQLVRQEIIQKYFNKGLIKRTNGLFIHFPKELVIIRLNRMKLWSITSKLETLHKYGNVKIF